jgi:hypothetical protein
VAGRNPFIVEDLYELSPLRRLLNLTRLVANRSFSIKDASALAFALFPAIGITSSVTATINSPSVVSICFFSCMVSAFTISWMPFPFAKRLSNRHAIGRRIEFPSKFVLVAANPWAEIFFSAAPIREFFLQAVRNFTSRHETLSSGNFPLQNG